jgi:hypothetical protein
MTMKSKVPEHGLNPSAVVLTRETWKSQQFCGVSRRH